MPEPRFILFFDSYCALCHWSVRFVLKHDKRRRLHFAPLHGDTWCRYVATDRIAQSGTSVLFFDGECGYEKSDAVIMLMKYLGWPWMYFSKATIVPRPWRNALYDYIAHRRYRWFGRGEACSLDKRIPLEQLLP